MGFCANMLMNSQLFVFILAITLFASPVMAERAARESSPRFSIEFGYKNNSNRSFSHLAAKAQHILEDTYQELGRIFDIQPKTRVSVRFVPRSSFSRTSGAPSYVRAMYHQGVITIPVDRKLTRNPHALNRSLRHEIVHAFVAELSNNQCPVWLDEGLAQHFDGSASASKKITLKNWLKTEETISLGDLHTRILRGNARRVNAAYAHSFIAARTLINRFGIKRLRGFITLLGKGVNQNKAFRKSFGISRRYYNQEFRSQILRWRPERKIAPKKEEWLCHGGQNCIRKTT